MKGIYYENTRTSIPGWISNLHETQRFGYAYETSTHFVHLYGKAEPFNVISVGLTAIQGKSGTLNDWVINTFGATNIQTLQNDIGHVVEGVWRPSLYYSDDIQGALLVDPFEKMSSGQALRNLINNLDELFLYIEPSITGLKAYSHKCRELLILACTEVENQWVSLIKKTNLNNVGARYTTRDYVRLADKCFLKEYKVNFKNYSGLRDFTPFLSWVPTASTGSLPWYDAYNGTKHDREAGFNLASLENVMDALSACIVLYCVKYGPYDLVSGGDLLSGTFNEHFSLSFINSDKSSYYVPELNFNANAITDLCVIDCYREKLNKAWVTEPLVL